MTRGGHNRKPARLHVLEGTARPSRRKNPPKPALVIPERPGWLAPEAAAEWDRITPELARLGVVTLVDRAALATYCQAWARYVEAERIIAEEGIVVEGHRGVAAKNPATTVARQAAETMLALSREFGLTPLSRSRLNLPEAATDQDCPRCSMPLDICGCK